MGIKLHRDRWDVPEKSISILVPLVIFSTKRKRLTSYSAGKNQEEGESELEGFQERISRGSFQLIEMLEWIVWHGIGCKEAYQATQASHPWHGCL